MPIKMYNKVQTGANIQLGGLNEGLFNVKYQVSIELWVANPEKNPIPKHTATAITIFGNFFNISQFGWNTKLTI